MNHPLVVHVRRKYDVYAGRGVCPKTGKRGEWGNPFLVGAYGRFGAIDRYREWLVAQPELVAKVRRDLRGKVLGCWCAPEACHADVLAEIANA